jgi:hypothetical protein
MGQIYYRCVYTDDITSYTFIGTTNTRYNTITTCKRGFTTKYMYILYIRIIG